MGKADLQLTLTATVKADGTAEILTGPNQTNLTWELEQITVNATPADTTSPAVLCAVYLNKTLVCATSAGQQDVASGDPPVSVPAGSQLAILWAGAAVGQQCTALLLGDQSWPG